MLNQIVICGRITQDPQIKELEEKKESIITIAVLSRGRKEEE